MLLSPGAVAHCILPRPTTNAAAKNGFKNTRQLLGLFPHEPRNPLGAGYDDQHAGSPIQGGGAQSATTKRRRRHALQICQVKIHGQSRGLALALSLGSPTVPRRYIPYGSVLLGCWPVLVLA